jgi:non-ribosomal peptide synthetase component E (peptide arylation enzyme)
VAIVDGDYQLTVRGLTVQDLIAAVTWQQRQLRAAGVRRSDVVCTQLPNWWELIA